MTYNHLLEKVPKLIASLRQNDWHVTVFDIFYKMRYIVVFEDTKDFPHPNKYFVAKITFIKTDGTDEELTVYANAQKMDVSLTDFVRFFGITGNGSYVDFIKNFYEIFNKQMPEEFKPIEREYVDYAINVINRQEPNNGTCCYDARRNLMPNSSTKYKNRSIFNTEKTKLLRPTLFNKIGNDSHISFYYRERNALDDNEILEKFKKRIKNN